MRSRIHSVVLPSEVGEFSDEVRRIFAELARDYGADALAGECSPPLDVFETDDALEISMDLPGVDPGAVHVVVKGQTILIAGQKAPRRGRGESSFHLVERGFGRFARTIRLAAACDTARARARLSEGELRVTLPKIADRRGRPIKIAVTDGPHHSDKPLA
jgi:HSP20 family protein